MDPRQSKPNSPPVRRAPSETEATADTRVRPYRAPGDPILEPPERPDEIGRLGHYRVLDELGRGGMGVVYRAEDTHLRRQVALKVMLPDAAADPRSRARFQREARAQAQVEHDHVAVIFQVDEVGGVPFIAMPLLKGQMLASALKQNPRPPVAELVRIGREIAEGLAGAHAAGLIHRDIKPANIWLEGAKRRVKILDFGLAREQAKAADRPGDEAEPLTDRGVVLGTPSYMSPEQAHGRALDPRTDLWSLGVVLYEMATGRKPFTGPSPFAVLVAASQQEPVSPAALVPELPPALNDFIRKLLSKKPADRPQTAEAAAEALAAIERGLVPLPVQVMPLPSVVGAPAGPDPWADIDATQTDEVAQTVPERAAARPRTHAPKWLWPVVALLGLVAAGALVSWAFPWWKPKKVEPTDPPTPPVAAKPPGDKPVDNKKPPDDPERRAAEWVVSNHGHVALWSGNQYLGAYPTAGDLPKPPYRVTGIELKSGAFDEKAPDNLRELKGLTAFTLDGPTVTDAALAKFLDSPGAANLQALFVKADVGDAALKPLPNLRQLTAVTVRSKNLTDTGAEYLRGLPLTRVDLSRSKVRAGLAALAGKNLTFLSLDTCGNVDDAALEPLKGTTTLKDVNLARTKVGTAGLAHLSGNTGLVSLDIAEPKLDLSQPKAARDGLDQVVRFSKLYSLFLDSRDVSDADLARLKALPELRHLTLRQTPVTGEGLKHLAEMKLTKLELQHLALGAEALKHLEGAATLDALFLDGEKVSKADAKKLAEKLSWCEVHCGNSQFGPTDANWVVATRLVKDRAGVTLVARHPTGKEFTVAKWDDVPNGRFQIVEVSKLDKSSPFGDADLKALAGLTGVRRLFLVGHQLTAGALRDLLAWKKTLTALSLAAGSLTPAGLEVVGQLAELKHLTLDRTGTADADLEQLAALSGLETLSLIGNPGVTDAGVKRLAGMKGLKELDLRLTLVSGAAVPDLSTLTNLTTLDLTGTKVMEEGAKTLAAALPKCVIRYGDGKAIGPAKKP